MSAVELTDWFPPGAKPVRPGVYETRLLDNDAISGAVIGQGYSYWNGALWCNQSSSAQSAAGVREPGFAYQTKPWRGLAQDPTPPDLLQFARSIEIADPDSDGCVWMRFSAPNATQAAINLGSGIVARAGLSLEQLRKEAVSRALR